METQKTQKVHRSTFKNISEMEKALGTELGLTPWSIMDQKRINTFAKTTEDEQWIHIDKEKSEKYSPYKTTIAHGFMILSLASRFSYDTLTIESVKMCVNYGVDRVRFTSATPSSLVKSPERISCAAT